jgi:hypothetical protein
MLRKLPHFGYVLTDNSGLPRYWAAAWTLLIGGSLAETTLKKKLIHIEAFYQHAEDGHEPGLLDDALGLQDLPTLEGLLESYFVTLRSVPQVRSSAEQRWRDAVGFVREISERLTRTPEMSIRLADVSVSSGERRAWGPSLTRLAMIGCRLLRYFLPSVLMRSQRQGSLLFAFSPFQFLTTLLDELARY